MNPFVFERKQNLPISLNEAWSFFSSPGNLEKITPPAMEFRITSAPQTATYAGQIITYTVRPLFGISMTWTSEITHVSEPHFFVDEQRFGPYRFWHHQHFFRETPEGTEVRDLIHYMLFHDQFATLINRIIVTPRLRKIFDYRAKSLETNFNK